MAPLSSSDLPVVAQARVAGLRRGAAFELSGASAWITPFIPAPSSRLERRDAFDTPFNGLGSGGFLAAPLFTAELLTLPRGAKRFDPRA